jgi:pyruvate dehydrogenase E2 component (dihydrolipoamide acetyltransferase)
MASFSGREARARARLFAPRARERMPPAVSSQDPAALEPARRRRAPTRFVVVRDASSFRKIAAAMWRPPRDPTIYGTLDVDATPLLAFIESFREREATKLTVSHVVARALALAIARHPEVNAKVRFWGRLEQRESIDIVLQVATDGGRDLAAARIDDADRKSLADIAQELARQASRIREGRDERYASSRTLFQRLPWWLTRPVLGAADLVTNELHWHLPRQGMPRDPFGTAMVTNVGMFGIDTAFAPLTPIARCPILVLVTEVRDRPWVHDGAVVVRPVLRLCATFDHRIVDGFHAGKLAREMHALLAAPEEL